MTQSPLNGITQAVDIEEEGLRPTTGKQWLRKSLQFKDIPQCGVFS